MSRIGKSPILLSDKIELSLSNNIVRVKGPLGELSFDYRDDQVTVEKKDNHVLVTPVSEKNLAMCGTTRAIINNMIVGVSEGYKKSLEINGVGYKFEVQGNKLVLSIGYSHKVEMDIPQELKLELDGKAKNILHIFGIDKQLVGEFASKIRAKKKPEPYKGKGIKYVGEHIIRKAGKTGK